jgi:hypothetical protein
MSRHGQGKYAPNYHGPGAFAGYRSFARWVVVPVVIFWLGLLCGGVALEIWQHWP